MLQKDLVRLLFFLLVATPEDQDNLADDLMKRCYRTPTASRQ